MMKRERALKGNNSKGERLMRRFVALLLCCVFFMEISLWAGLDSDHAMYVGGTVTTLKDGTEGKVSAKGEDKFVFSFPTGDLSIPYDRINDLEYGQKAGRRLGVAIVVTWMALFSKKRKHFLTIGYNDENNKQQAAVFELG